MGLALGLLTACTESTPPAASAAPPTDEPAAPRLEVARGPTSRVTTPDGAPLELSLEVASPRFFLGENVLVHHVVTNPGPTPTSIGWGGDYRGGTRHARYRVEVIAEDGARAPDPDPSGFNMGGLGGDYEIEPGARYVQTLGLGRYARIERPGRYRVRVFHDLGWDAPEGGPTPEDPRWSEIEVTMVMPDAIEARRVVDRMRGIPEDPGVSHGEPRPPYPDYLALQYRPYLPILRALVVEERATELMAGIAMMPLPEATDVLLELAAHPVPEISVTATEAVIARLPPIAGPNQRTAFTPRDFSREFLSGRAWRTRHDAPAQRLGLALLGTDDPTTQQRGAALLEALATPAEFAAVVRALDHALERSEALGATKHYPHPATAHGSLLRVVESLLARGAVVDVDPTSPGMIAAYLVRWGTADDRPADYAERAAAWMRHPIPTVRELAVERTRDPLPAAMQAELADLLTSGELSLQVHACDAIAALKQARFGPELLTLARSAEDEWLLRAIESAALASGVSKTTIMGVWIDRLDQPGMGWRMFDLLKEVLSQSGGNGFGKEPSPEDARRLAREWRAFVRAHGDAIDRGVVFSLDGPEYTPALVPEGTELSPR